MTRSIHVLTLALSALALTGCDDWGDFGDFQRYKEDFHYSYDLKPGGRFSLETMNGSVEISSWEKNTVDVSGTKYASEEAALRAIRIDITHSPDSVYVRTVRPSGYRNGLGARYIIRVPKSVELDNITSSNGAVRVDNVEGNGRVRTSNGSVRVNQVKGSYEVTTSNGAVEVNDQTGGLIIHTSNGGVRAENIRGALEAVTSNGRITARLMDPEQNRPIKLESSNGSIDLTMDHLKNNEIRASSSNSSITLHLPGTTSAQLKARTSNSHVESDFDMLMKGGRITKTSVEGEIGGGGPMIDLSTSNGSIQIRKL